VYRVILKPKTKLFNKKGGEMITRIGLVAGDIWNYLDHHGGSTDTEELINAIQKDRNLALMGIGWLAREGHVILDGEGPVYSIRLTNNL
jgi:hypothetical protein